MERSVSGAAVLDKAVAILDELAGGPLTLAELARRTGIARPTAHRLCASLEFHDLIARDEEDRRSLGSRLRTWAGAVEDEEDRLIAGAKPVLERLRDETGESVQLYVRHGSHRRVVAGLESLHGLRTIVDVGAQLPLTAGSGGAVLREDADTLRRGWAQSVEEREKGVASVSAPIWLDGVVVAAVSISGPVDRMTRSPGKRYAAAITAAARHIEAAIGSPGRTPASGSS